MQMKLIKKVEVVVTTDEFDEVNEELSETHCGCADEYAGIETNVNDLQLYMDSNPRTVAPDAYTIIECVLTFANRHHVEEVKFTH